MEKIEYRVRPVIRYVVTRFYESASKGGSELKGEFGNYRSAYDVAYALCKDEHSRLGWKPADDRIQYPREIMGVEQVELLMKDCIENPEAAGRLGGFGSGAKFNKTNRSQ